MTITPNEGDREAPEIGDRGELDRSLVHGIAWTGTFKWAGQLLAWASTIFIARLLVPEDYGLVGMATIYLGFVTVLNSAGFGSAVVMIRSLTPRQVAQLNSIAITLGVASFLLSFVAADLLARFFNTPELVPVVIAMSAGVIFGAFRTIPQALLSGTNGQEKAQGQATVPKPGVKMWPLLRRALKLPRLFPVSVY